MLPPSFRWRIDAETAFLDLGPVNVAHVQPFGGRLTLTIRWQGKTVGGIVGSIQQGVRYAERWLRVRPGPGGLGARRRWYDEISDRRMDAEAMRIAQPRIRRRRSAVGLPPVD